MCIDPVVYVCLGVGVSGVDVRTGGRVNCVAMCGNELGYMPTRETIERTKTANRHKYGLEWFGYRLGMPFGM
jgi:hypothetical protein